MIILSRKAGVPSSAELADSLIGHRAEKVLYPLITAFGIGCLFQVWRQPRAFKIANFFIASTHRSASSHATEGHGYVHGRIWLPQVCGSCMRHYIRQRVCDLGLWVALWGSPLDRRSIQAFSRRISREFLI